MIPKIIHYVWVGNNPKSDLVNKCIASWKKYCPDYEIKEWNNESLREIDNQYVKEAFECKKWAFVSDYLRLYALKEFGGIYCDSDLELMQPIDEFLTNDFFTGYENYRKFISPVTALMGAVPNNHIIQGLLSEYNDIHFIVKGQMDMTTNVKRISAYFLNKFGLKDFCNGSEKTLLNETSVIYPSYYFCTPEYGKINYSIHHFNGSWVDPYTRKNKFSIGKYTLASIRKNKKDVTGAIPLSVGEKIVFTIREGRKRLCIIKKEAK